MKLLLLNPPSNCFHTAPPLGLACLAAFMRQHRPDLDLRLVDANYLDGGAQALRRLVAREQPDLLGIYALTFNHQNVHDTARLLRPHARWVVCGGPYATAFPGQVLADPNIEFAVVGEGELPLLRLVEALEGGGDPAGLELPRTLHRSAPERPISLDEALIQDLDQLPWPAWDLLNPARYFSGPRPASISTVTPSRYVLPVMTSRGCPHGCVTCLNTFGRTYRARSAQSIAAEFSHLIQTYGVQGVEVADDRFFMAREQVTSLSEALRERQIKTRIVLTNCLRLEDLDLEIVDLLEAMGVWRVNLTLEGRPGDRLGGLPRDLADPRTEALVRHIAATRMVLGTFLVLGYPGETRQELERTVARVNQLPFDIVNLFLAPHFFGTDLYQTLKEAQKEPAFRGPSGPQQAAHSGLDIQALRRLHRHAMARIYTNPRRISRLLRKLDRPTLTRNLGALLRYTLGREDRLYFAD